MRSGARVVSRQGYHSRGSCVYRHRDYRIHWQERRERGRESVGEGDGEGDGDGGSRRGLQRWSLVSRTAIGESLIITMYSVHCTLYVVRCTSYTV